MVENGLFEDLPVSETKLLKGESFLGPLRPITRLVPDRIRQPISRLLRGTPGLNTVKTVEVDGISADFFIRRHMEAIRVQAGYEPEVLAALTRALSECTSLGSCVFVNVGAAEGLFTILGAKIAKRTYAFEPDGECLQSLNTNIALNNLNEKIRVLPVALGSEEGSAVFYTDSKKGEAASLRKTSGQRSKTVVQVNRLDGLVNAKVVERPDVVLIDVEGAEMEVLKGFGDICPRHLILEIHTSFLVKFGSSVDEVAKFVLEKGYKLNFAVRRKNEIQAYFILDSQGVDLRGQLGFLS